MVHSVFRDGSSVEMDWKGSTRCGDWSKRSKRACEAAAGFTSLVSIGHKTWAAFLSFALQLPLPLARHKAVLSVLGPLSFLSLSLSSSSLHLTPSTQYCIIPYPFNPPPTVITLRLAWPTLTSLTRTDKPSDKTKNQLLRSFLFSPPLLPTSSPSLKNNLCYLQYFSLSLFSFSTPRRQRPHNVMNPSTSPSYDAIMRDAAEKPTWTALPLQPTD